MPSSLQSYVSLIDRNISSKGAAPTLRDAMVAILGSLDRRLTEQEGKSLSFDAARAALISNVLLSASEVLSPIANDFNALLAAAQALHDQIASGAIADAALTGTPTAPTAAPGTGTTQIASTAFVAAGLAALRAGLVAADIGDSGATGRALLQAASAAAAKIALALVKADVGLGNADNTSDVNKPVSTAQQTALNLKADLVLLAVANGIATLGADGKVPTSQLPASVLGSVSYQGIWNAATNTPAIPAAAAGNKGWYYKVSTAGTTAIDGIADWQIGDWIISNGASWEKVDNTDLVLSVAGLTGAIAGAALKTALALVKADVGLGNADNTSDVNKPVSTAQQTALNLKADLASPTFTGTVTAPRLRSMTVTLATDAATAIPIAAGSGPIILIGPSTASARGIYFARTGAAGTLARLSDAAATPVFDLTATALTGTTGVAGNATLGCPGDGNLYIENRTGVSRTWVITLLY